MNNNIYAHKSPLDLIIGIISCGFSAFLMAGYMISYRYSFHVDYTPFYLSLIFAVIGIVLMIRYGVKKPHIYKIDENGNRIKIK